MRVKSQRVSLARVVLALLLCMLLVYASAFSQEAFAGGGLSVFNTKDGFYHYTEDTEGQRLTNGSASGNTHNYPADKNKFMNEQGGSFFLDSEGFVPFQDSSGRDTAYLRKYVKETAENNGLFDLTLAIKGNEIVHPLDVVFLIDYSSTMKGTNLENAINGVEVFLNAVADPLLNSRLRVGAIAYNRSVYSTDDFLTDPDAILSFLRSTAQNGTGTFTQKGLYAAQELFDTKGRADAQFLLIHIGDGDVNCSYLPEDGATKYPNDGNIFPVNGYNTASYIKDFQTGIPSYNTAMTTSDSNAITGYSRTSIAHHTLGTAVAIKERAGKKIEIFSIGTDPAARAEYVARNLASSPSHYASIDEDLQGLSETLAGIASEIDNTINHGTVSDPMGEYVLLQKGPDGSFDQSDYTLKGYTQDSSTGTWIEDSHVIDGVRVIEDEGVIQLLNLNLGSREKLEFSYQVRLNTESPSFSPDTWYLSNKETTLDPTSAGEFVPFPLPSIKAPSTTIDIEKKWDDQILVGGGNTAYDYAFMRPSDISVVVLREKTSSSSAWAETEPISITQGENWKKTLSTIIPKGMTNEVKLPLYNNLGETFVYSVSEVKNSAPKYTWTVSSTSQQVVISNTLITTDLSFNKLGVSDEALAGAVFELRNRDSSITYASGTSDSSGYVSFSQIPPGEYLLVETVAPTGHEGGLTIPLTVVNEEGELNIYIDHTDTLGEGSLWEWDEKVFNVPESTDSGSFPFVKHLENGENSTLPLEDVAFTLTPIYAGNGPHTKSSTGSDAVVNFTGVASGVYVLSEDATTLPVGISLKPAAPILVLVYWNNGVLDVRFLNLDGQALPLDNEGRPIVINKQTVGFSFIKRDRFGPEGIAGVQFELRNPDGSIAASAISSGYEGRVQFADITKGSYMLYEVNPPDGYQPVDPIEVVVGFPPGGNMLSVLRPSQFYPVQNHKVLTSLEFKKVSESGVGLQGAEFALYKSSTIDRPLATAYSDAEGKVVFYNIAANEDYLIKELKPPLGYEAKPSDFEVAVSVGYEDSNPKVTNPENWYDNGGYKIVNTLKVRDISFTKRGDFDDILAGITFDLCDENGTVIRSAVSDNNGLVTFKDVSMGKYLLVEHNPEGIMNLEPFEIEVVADQKNDLQVLANWDYSYPGNNLINQHITSGFSFTKLSFDERTPLSGAVFEIRNSSGEVVQTARSDERGVVHFDGLLQGQYELLETLAPEGYLPLEVSLPIAVEFIEGELVTYFDTAALEGVYSDGKVYNRLNSSDQDDPHVNTTENLAATGDKLPGLLLSMAILFILGVLGLSMAYRSQKLRK